jgi:hypothetical protein
MDCFATFISLGGFKLDGSVAKPAKVLGCHGNTSGKVHSLAGSILLHQGAKFQPLSSRASRRTSIRSSLWPLPLIRIAVERMLSAVVLIESSLDRERRFVAFFCSGFDPSARGASPSRKRTVLQPDKLSSHGRIFSHMFERLAVT